MKRGEHSMTCEHNFIYDCDIGLMGEMYCLKCSEHKQGEIKFGL